MKRTAPLAVVSWSLLAVLAQPLGLASPAPAPQPSSAPGAPALDFEVFKYVFQKTWKNRSVGELFDRIRNSMPQNEPGTLSPQRTAEIVAYILSANELPAGNRALGEEVESLTQIRMDAGQP